MYPKHLTEEFKDNVYNNNGTHRAGVSKEGLELIEQGMKVLEQFRSMTVRCSGFIHGSDTTNAMTIIVNELKRCTCLLHIILTLVDPEKAFHTVSNANSRN